MIQVEIKKENGFSIKSFSVEAEKKKDISDLVCDELVIQVVSIVGYFEENLVVTIKEDAKKKQLKKVLFVNQNDVVEKIGSYKDFRKINFDL